MKGASSAVPDNPVVPHISSGTVDIPLGFVIVFCSHEENVPTEAFVSGLAAEEVFGAGPQPLTLVQVLVVVVVFDDVGVVVGFGFGGG